MALDSGYFEVSNTVCGGGRTMTEKDLEIQSLRRALKLTEEMYDKQLELNEQLYSINELLASENAALKTEIEKIGRMNDGEE